MPLIKKRCDARHRGNVPETRPFDVSYKVMVLGESSVGKTALIKTLAGENFSPLTRSTIGMDFVKRVFEIDGANIQLDIWDTAGQERFRSLTKFQYRGAKGLLLVYDVTNMNTFNTLNYWLETIDKELDLHQREPAPVFILGNKCDEFDARVVTTEMGVKLASSSYVHGFMETSAKQGYNVYKAFANLAQAVTEVHDPKLMNSYLCPFEKEEKETRKIGEQFEKFEKRKGIICLRSGVRKKLRCTCAS